jgi:hypothetical protein
MVGKFLLEGRSRVRNARKKCMQYRGGDAIYSSDPAVAGNAYEVDEVYQDACGRVFVNKEGRSADVPPSRQQLRPCSPIGLPEDTWTCRLFCSALQPSSARSAAAAQRIGIACGMFALGRQKPCLLLALSLCM